MKKKGKSKFQISEKDKKALFLLLTIVIIAVSYFFIWQPNMKKADALQGEVEALDKRYKDLIKMKSQEQEKTEETASYNEKTGAILNLFPPKVRTEDCIMLVDQMEKQFEVEVSSESFTTPELFYPLNMDLAALEQNAQEDGADEEEGESSVSGPAFDFIGYKTTMNLSFKSTYQGFKDIVNFIIKNDKNRMAVNSVNVSYDSGTGELTGSMAVSLYSLNTTIGEIYNRVYEPPVVEQNGYGTDNIFGTSKAQ